MGLVFGPLFRMVLRRLRNLVLRDGVPFWYIEQADFGCDYCDSGFACDCGGQYCEYCDLRHEECCCD